MSANVIELNGKRYDSRSGAFLGSSSAPVAGKSSIKAPAAGRSMDGFVTKPASALTTVPAISVQPTPTQHSATPKLHASKQMPAHKPQHSKTLMRHVVKSPKIAPKQPIKVQAPTDMVKAAPAVLGVKPKLSSDQIDVPRSQRALGVPRSSSVVRFQRAQSPQRFTPATQPIARRPVAHAQQPQTRATAVRPAADQDMFERALASATSHEQVAPKESRRHKARHGGRKHLRAVSISATVLAMLFLGGFVAYQNKIALELQFASAHAGIAASMPGYRPAGYSAHSLRYGAGSVIIGFNSGSHSFTLAQDKSNWDSETLLQNYVADTNQPYQAYQAAGRTVYIYGNGNATWVNGGVWYKVSGNANLNTKQIINLATSI